MITAEQRNLSKGKPRTTIRHRLALKEIIDSGGKNIGNALAQAGYSIPTQQNPQKVTKSLGFRALLEKEGLTEAFVTKALFEDINGKPRKRVEELKLAADILRMRGNNTQDTSFTPTQVVITQINMRVDDTEAPETPLNASRINENTN